MAGAFSGHLIESFLSAQRTRGSFGQPPQHIQGELQLHTHGAMSFAPQMHGTFNNQASSSLVHMDLSACTEMSQETAQRIATLQAKLSKRLGPEFVSERPGPGGGPRIMYIEGWRVINLANEVFGFNGWSSSVVNLTTDYMDVQEQTGRVSAGVTAVIRITLRDGTFHEDVGYGQIDNVKGKGAALDKCKKEAVTDGVKRALRNFGSLLGNCLYDKSFTRELVKIKVPPPKFDKTELYRRPEFDESNKSHAGPSVPSTSAATASGSRSTNQTTAERMPPPVNSVPSVPSHLRARSGPTSSSTTAVQRNSPINLAEHSTPVRSGDSSTSNASGARTGLITPAQTPAHQQQQEPKSNIPNGVVYRQSDHGKPRPQQRQTPPVEKRVSFVQPSDSTTGNPKQPPALSVSIPDPPLDVDDESFGLNSEDDAFFASVDLGEGDSGIGGHIDFDEGASGVYVDEIEEDTPPIQPPQRQDQQRSGIGPANLNPVGSAAGDTSFAQSGPNGQSRTSASPVGGFHFPTGADARPGAGSSSSIGIKRSADAMQSSGSRRPFQGMGLSHQPGGQRRLPLAPLEGSDLKRLRR